MPDRGVAAAAVVAVLDPCRDLADRAGPGGLDTAVVELRFQDREEALSRVTVLADGHFEAADGR
jgi:hypothetical protein